MPTGSNGPVGNSSLKIAQDLQYKHFWAVSLIYSFTTKINNYLLIIQILHWFMLMVKYIIVSGY